MMTSQRAFQAQMFAKQHYRKLLTAKSTLTQNMRPTKGTPSYTPNKTLSPLDRYQYRMTNDKICTKLTEIYKCPDTAFRKYRRSSREKSARSMNGQTLREQGKTITKDNVDMFQRILCAKSTISQDWKARQRKLKRYGKLARKNTGPTSNQDSLFEAYQHLLMQSRAGSAKKRPRTSKTRNVSSARSRSNSLNPAQTI